jgi:cyclic-di-GMP phosphodiesterase TipF (flagellum assembly factor)
MPMLNYYEATSRLRSETGEILLARDYVPLAESSGLLPRIDNLVIFRCVSIVRRLVLKNRDIGLFCSLSQATLTDTNFFPQLRDFMAANRALAPSLVLQFTHGAVRAMGGLEHESLAAVTEHGFRFSMNHVTSLRLEPGELAERGFRYIHVHADLMLKKAVPVPTDVLPADVPDLLGRFGIDLIVEGIEHESSVIDLLDRDVRYGQGALFSPPRPVRPEALQAMPDFPDAVTGERRSAADQLAPAGGPAPNARASSPGPDDAKQGAAAQIAGGVPARG